MYIADLLIFAVSACKNTEPMLPKPVACENTKYTFSDVQYIFENGCVGCHSYALEAVAVGDFSFYQVIEVGYPQ